MWKKNSPKSTGLSTAYFFDQRLVWVGNEVTLVHIILLGVWILRYSLNIIQRLE